VEHGLVSVGLKIHCLDDGQHFNTLIQGLGGARKVLEVNHYKDARASLCLVLPPVASATSAIHLIECIEQFNGSPIFDNRQIQLQLCSPGQLSARASALLGISFYLGSDTLRRYTQADFRTTFASHFIHSRGIRLVLYDAEGDFDRDFAWWNEHGIPEPRLPFRNGRTDLLIGSGSRLDIQNINLVATLLAHSVQGTFARLASLFLRFPIGAQPISTGGNLRARAHLLDRLDRGYPGDLVAIRPALKRRRKG
jgi:hypothetical protein